jgi:copper chaperone CopZ
MKKILILILVVFTIASFAQSKVIESKIKVFGNCVMCKKRIETALEVKGVKTATWNTETKELDVIYNKTKITEKQIHELVASVGHDTELVKAKDVVYADLPFCCLYRDHDHKNMKDSNSSHDHH